MEAERSGMTYMKTERSPARHARTHGIRRLRRRRRGGASQRRTSCRSSRRRTPADVGGGRSAASTRELVRFAPVGVAQGGAEGSLRGLAEKRGPKPSGERPEARKVRRLERQVARLREELRKARIIVDVQGKVAGLLGVNPGDGKRSRARPGGLAGHVGVRGLDRAGRPVAGGQSPSPRRRPSARPIPTCPRT